MNRGIGKRVVFPDRHHIRMFLACLALEVRRGDLEIHAFCVMATHFHLLVRSPAGRLSPALARALNTYVRWYNRRARRDGPLFRGRFRSRPVLSLAYRDAVVRYIEHNAVSARIFGRCEDYPFCSAALRVGGRVPPWLAGWWVDEVLECVRLVNPGVSYASLWCRRPTADETALVEERLRRPPSPEDDLDDLVGAAPAHRAPPRMASLRGIGARLP